MSDLIDRQGAIKAICKALCDHVSEKTRRECVINYPCKPVEIIKDAPTAEPEIIRCKECIYYDPEHIENNGIRYEYKDMPKEAFDELGTGLVNTEYGINVGGRCCRDYNVGYSEDKRVFVPENNYCGRAERRTDE